MRYRAATAAFPVVRPELAVAKALMATGLAALSEIRVPFRRVLEPVVAPTWLAGSRHLPGRVVRPLRSGHELRPQHRTTMRIVKIVSHWPS